MKLKIKYAPHSDFTFAFPPHFAYIGIPKCASCTLRESFYGGHRRHYSPRSAAMACEVRFSVIRHPFDRVLSAWNYGWKDVPFEEWWAEVRKNPRFDLHTFPYAEYLGNDYTELYRLENIETWWPQMHQRFPKLFVPKPRKANYGGPDYRQPFMEDYQQDILSVYRDDLELWSLVGPEGLTCR